MQARCVKYKKEKKKLGTLDYWRNVMTLGTSGREIRRMEKQDCPYWRKPELRMIILCSRGRTPAVGAGIPHLFNRYWTVISQKSPRQAALSVCTSHMSPMPERKKALEKPQSEHNGSCFSLRCLLALL